jgi:putative ABC transport system permease protein
MLKNYLTIAVRNLFRNKAFSLINISGLVLGMTCSLLIFLWVWDEQSVDAYHANNDHLFGIHYDIYGNDFGKSDYNTPGPLARELKLKIPEIQYASSLFMLDKSPYFKKGNENIKVKGGYASADFFSMFSYQLLQGSLKTALTDFSDIAISRKMAENFFGSPEAAFGRSVSLERSQSKFINFKVCAVFENLSANSSQKFDFLINWKFLLDSVKNDLGLTSLFYYEVPLQTYVMLKPGTNPGAVNIKIKDFLTQFKPTDKAQFRVELGMTRFDKMYLYNHFENGKPSGGRIEYVHIFTIVAIFILLIACINFMNLTTARSVKRAKEIGIRKTVGAIRSKLIIQFLSEAILLSFLSAVLSLFLVALALPTFNELTGKQLSLPALHSFFWWMMLFLVLMTGFISGSYPALFLSSLNPIKVFKGSLQFSWSAIWFRKSLVIFQFSISIVLIIGAIVVAKQVNYVQAQDLGYNKENLIYIPIEGELGRKFDVFKQELSHMPGIKSLTHRYYMFSNIQDDNTPDISWPGKDPKNSGVVSIDGVGYDFIKTMGLPLIQGRDFSRDFPTDTTNFIINEKALSMIGYKDPIGRSLTLDGRKGKIIGLVKDFNFGSLQYAISPLVLYMSDVANGDPQFAVVRTQSGHRKEAIASMQQVYRQMDPQHPFTYQFCDQEYQRLYRNEQLIGRLSDSFALLAIVISCLGLLGLAMFTTEQRTKEIGIRKVLGASAGNIVVMLSKDILKLVIISALLASPFALLAMNQWLQHFAYRVNISAWLFIGAAFFALLIALSTISLQAVKAALANPVKSLKIE